MYLLSKVGFDVIGNSPKFESSTYQRPRLSPTRAAQPARGASSARMRPRRAAWCARIAAWADLRRTLRK